MNLPRVVGPEAPRPSSPTTDPAAVPSAEAGVSGRFDRFLAKLAPSRPRPPAAVPVGSSGPGPAGNVPRRNSRSSGGRSGQGRSEDEDLAASSAAAALLATPPKPEMADLALPLGAGTSPGMRLEAFLASTETDEALTASVAAVLPEACEAGPLTSGMTEGATTAPAGVDFGLPGAEPGADASPVGSNPSPSSTATDSPRNPEGDSSAVSSGPTPRAEENGAQVPGTSPDGPRDDRAGIAISPKDPGASGENGAGTGVAEFHDVMRQTHTRSNSSGLARQELPLVESGGAEARPTAVSLPEVRKVESVAGTRPVNVWFAPPVSFTTSPVADATLDAEVRTAGTTAEERVGRIAELVDGAVVRCRQIDAGEIEVAIRPDAATEIHLRVSLVAGTPEVRAELRRGDAAAFAAHWPELQQRLAQQGVRLESLVPASGNSSASTAFSGGGSRSRSDESRPQTDPRPSSGRSSSLSRVSIERNEPARSLSGRRWETWA